MSTLTRVFIVLLAVFSIAFTMSAISFVVKTNNWKSLANEYQAEAQVAETHMRNLSASHAAEKATWLDVTEDLNGTIDALRSENDRLTNQVSELRAQLASVKSEKDSAAAQARMLTGQLEIAQKGWTRQSEQREALEERNMELERRNQDLDLRVNELSTQIVAMREEQRQLEQQINILEKANKALARQAKEPPTVLDDTTTVSAGRILPLTETTGSPIRGRIVEVEGDRATISVGSADGVEAGMVFIISRGSDRDSAYIGDLEITDVTPNMAAGEITLRNGTPKPGDRVIDEAGSTLAD